MILLITFEPENRLGVVFPNYVDHTDDLIEFHVWTVHARSKEQLEMRLLDRKSVSIEGELENGPKSYGEYKAKITSYGDRWLLNDCRPLWFLKDFEKLTNIEMIVAIKSKNDRYNTLVNEVLGKRKDALVLGGYDLGKIEEWMNSSEKKDEVTNE